ncbi:MAG: hypothetical protein H6720_11440 [Sandaracinus sp.]|nr:hypothetical protein [Sandaracinus sp.]
MALVVRRGGTLHTHLLGGARGRPARRRPTRRRPSPFSHPLVPQELDADPTTPEVLLLVRNPDPTVIACRLAPVPSCSPAMVRGRDRQRIEVPQATADGFAYGANRVVIRWP